MHDETQPYRDFRCPHYFDCLTKAAKRNTKLICAGCRKKIKAKVELKPSDIYDDIVRDDALSCLKLLIAVFWPELDSYRHRGTHQYTREKEQFGSIADIRWMG
ncbi:MAG TPA: hypothetical protein PLS62_11225 [Desulfobacteraceae bacterium]|nr:hypothetical protein [Desulfobacteraceae bacterium]